MAEAAKLSELLSEQDILLDAEIDTKPALLALAAERLAAATGLESGKILAALTDREKLGSTAINRGVAVPHAGLDALTKPAALFLRLAHPIEFEASDKNPVDLAFVMIWPNEKRKGLFATLSGLCWSLREEAFLRDLRDASDPAEMQSLLAQSEDEAASRKGN